MPETLEPKVKDNLRAYLRDVKTLHNEANTYLESEMEEIDKLVIKLLSK